MARGAARFRLLADGAGCACRGAGVLREGIRVAEVTGRSAQLIIEAAGDARQAGRLAFHRLVLRAPAALARVQGEGVRKLSRVAVRTNSIVFVGTRGAVSA